MEKDSVHQRILSLPDEAATVAFAHQLSLFVRAGDVITLSGDLGTGKTVFARGFIRALCPDMAERPDIPSPTFTLVQTYEFTRVPVAHFDFYRVRDPDEVPELGFPGLAEGAVLIAEWPGRAEPYLPADRLDLELSDEPGEGSRQLTLNAHGAWRLRAARMEIIEAFLDAAGYQAYGRSFLQGDASARRYEQLVPAGGRSAALILMDSPQMPDGEPVRGGLPYSQIAHLAENVTAFAAIDQGLRQAGLAAPEILAHDLEAGLLIIEDLGGALFQDMVRQGNIPMDAPYRASVDVLCQVAEKLTDAEVTLPTGEIHKIPLYDATALEIEAELLLDWYWPTVHETAAGDEVRARFLDIWRTLWPLLDSHQTVWCLRDYHSPNLIWRADKAGLDRVGVIDFQDTVLGHPAYDLASLLQDARVDVSPQREKMMLDYYLERRCAAGPGFDRQAFADCYAILAAQRATKILGIFMRLNERDGKPAYLQHIPRLWRYLERTLEAPVLADLKAWYGEAFPPALRSRA